MPQRSLNHRGAFLASLVAGAVTGCQPDAPSATPTAREHGAQSADPSAEYYVPPGEISMRVTHAEATEDTRLVSVEILSSPAAPRVEYQGWGRDDVHFGVEDFRDGKWDLRVLDCGFGLVTNILEPGSHVTDVESVWIADRLPVRIGFLSGTPGGRDHKWIWSEPIE
jgi:hypothetical protein